MRFDNPPNAIRLARRALMTIEDGVGDRIECLDGSLWITQERDPRDVVLEAGEAFTLDRRGKAVVYAFDASCLVVWPRVPLDRRPRMTASVQSPA